MEPHHEVNSLGQPIGHVVPNWQPVAFPVREEMRGRFCRLEPLDADQHGQDLYQANALDKEGRSWTYLPYGPFADFSEYKNWLTQSAQGTDPLYFAIVSETTGKAIGVSSYLRIDPNHGCIEVGHLNFSPLLQATPAATEAMYLMMERAFDLGYRRYEWKCHSMNAPSRRAAQRFGFSFEGIFRQAVVIKGRNRDTAWYSIIDQEWPALRSAFHQWLAPTNFDDQGKQRLSLASLTAALVQQPG